MNYDEGYKAGKADALNYFPPRADRTWKREFRNGYSDGYFDHSGKAKQW